MAGLIHFKAGCDACYGRKLTVGLPQSRGHQTIFGVQARLVAFLFPKALGGGRI